MSDIQHLTNVWRTPDGRLFEDEGAAVKHVRTCKLWEAVRYALKSSMHNPGSPDYIEALGAMLIHQGLDFTITEDPTIERMKSLGAAGGMA